MQRVVMVVVALIAAVVVTVPVVGQEAPDTLFIAKDDETLSNVEIAARLSENTPVGADRVVLARDDDFADALASGVMQGEAPLLLTPQEGLPARVTDRLAELGPSEVVLLGGTAALPEAIATDLSGRGYVVSRRAGASRFETATAIAAADAPEATTAILVRAFAPDGATDPTQAFADSLAAGGLAAANAWPVLLTTTAGLPAPTADYLSGSAIQQVYVVGGTAAISEQVMADLTALGKTAERIAGASRADTALQIAALRGAESAEDVGRVTLVDGQSADAWAGGFAAAAHSATFDAPIVLGTPVELPAATVAWLAGEGEPRGFAQAPVDPDGIRLTCVIDAVICTQARDALRLPPLGDFLVAGTCPGFNDATISADATTVVYIAEDGCPGHTGPADELALVFVDTDTAELTSVPLGRAGECLQGPYTNTSGAHATVDLCEADVETVLGVSRATGSVVNPTEICDEQIQFNFVPAVSDDGRYIIEGFPTCGGAIDVDAAEARPFQVCERLFEFGSDPNLCVAAFVISRDGATMYNAEAGRGDANDPQGGETSPTAPYLLVSDAGSSSAVREVIGEGSFNDCYVQAVDAREETALLNCTGAEPDFPSLTVIMAIADGATTVFDGYTSRGLSGDGTHFSAYDFTAGEAVIGEVATGDVTTFPGALSHPGITDDLEVVLISVDGGLRLVDGPRA